MFLEMWLLRMKECQKEIQKNFSVKIGRFHQKITYQLLYQNKSKMILMGISMFFHVKLSYFQNVMLFMSYTQKCTKNRQKFGFRRNEF